MPPILSSDEVHVWRIDLDRPPAVVERLAECLTLEERERAKRFLRQADGRRFVVSHAAMRAVLGTYLGVSAADVETTVSPGGKPELAPQHTESGLRFNLTHCEELALVAVGRNREIGVDVERVRPIAEMENIVKRYFAPGEVTAWLALAEGDRIAGFFRCWTRKEAYLKARGVGLSLGLDEFEVSLAADEPTGIVRDGRSHDASARWFFYDISPPIDYVAACVTRPAVTVQSFDWKFPGTAERC